MKRKTKENDRTYRVLAVAILEERRVGLLSKDEFNKRHREIFELCYGTTKPTAAQSV